MKITDIELNVTAIINVKKSQIPPCKLKCTDRFSDCFVYVISGEAEYTFNGKKQIATENSVFFLAKGSNYLIKVTHPNYTFIAVDFNFENINDCQPQNEIYSSKSISLTKSSFEKIYSLWKIGNFADKILCKSLIYKIYSSVAAYRASQYVTPTRKNQMDKLNEYIYKNLEKNDLNVSTLSKMCGVSEVHFRRIFNRVYHTTPIKFITAARINMAKELLLTSEDKLEKIALKCGFQNVYYFSKVFKSETNMTPGFFRKFNKTNI